MAPKSSLALIHALFDSGHCAVRWRKDRHFNSMLGRRSKPLTSSPRWASDMTEIAAATRSLFRKGDAEEKQFAD